jgi:uncharacterized lipoprotein YajG
MNLLNKVFLVASVVLFAACKNSKPATATTNPREVQPVSTPVLTATMSEPMENVIEDSVYALIVTFISRGEGPDSKAEAALDEIILQHAIPNGKPLAKEEFRWGREGEKDVCFKLLKMDEKVKAGFIKKVKEKFAGNKLVIISENSPCKHKR